MPRIYVGAGSNLEPEPRLRAGVAALERAFGAVRCSAVFRSTAVGSAAPDYLNLVVAFDSDREPAGVKAELVAIEHAGGRQRHGARPKLCSLDLDLLLYGTRVDAAQRLPHGDVLRRAFVLAPLAGLAPDLRHPVTGERFADAWRRMQGAGASIEEVGTFATRNG